MLYRLANDVYRAALKSGGIVLVKAAKKPSPGQLDLFGGGGGDFEESKHSRGSDGKFSSGGGGGSSTPEKESGNHKERIKGKMQAHSEQALSKFEQKAAEFKQKIGTMNVSRLREMDADGELNDELFLPHFVEPVIAAGRNGESVDNAKHADDLADNWDEHFPEASEAYDKHLSAINSAIDSRVQQADTEGDQVHSDSIQSFGDRAQSIVDSVDSPESWAKAKADLKEAAKTTRQEAFQKLKEVGADDDVKSYLASDLQDELDSFLESYSEDEWDE